MAKPCPVCAEPVPTFRIVHPTCKDQVRAESAHYMTHADAPPPEWALVPRTLLHVDTPATFGVLDVWRDWAAQGLPADRLGALRERLESLEPLAKLVHRHKAWSHYQMAEHLARIRAGQPDVLGDANRFAFQPGETPLYITTPSVVYQEDQIVREYKGKSRGVSVKVLPGVYVRGGRSRGRAVESQQRKVVTNRAQLAFTDKHLYVSYGRNAFRIAWRDLVTVQPNGHGFTLTRNSGLPQTFTVKYAWFFHALIADIREPGAPQPVAVPAFGQPPRHAMPSSSDVELRL